MKIFALLTLLAALTVAAPRNMLEDPGLEDLYFDSNELVEGECRPITLIYARGSRQPGNMGAWSDVGPYTCTGLKLAYGESEVACQGVGDPYYADITGNMWANDGTTVLAWKEAMRLFNLANSKCPKSWVVASGYSQGGAVITAAIRRLAFSVKARILAVAMYGSTRTDQYQGDIPNFDGQVLAICEPGDGVCDGDSDLELTEAHHHYKKHVPEAVDFMKEWLDLAFSGGHGCKTTRYCKGDGVDGERANGTAKIV